MEGLEDYGLTLRSGASEPASIGVWGELARAAGHDTNPEPETLAQVINISAYSLHFGTRLFNVIRSAVANGDAAELERCSRLMAGLKPEVLASALLSQKGLDERRRVIDAAAAVSSNAAVLALARATAVACEARYSTVLDTLLRKLEIQAARAGQRGRAEQANRLLLRQLMDMWSAPRLDASSALEEPATVETASQVQPEADRVVKLALETGALGQIVWAAVRSLSGESDLRQLLGLLRNAPDQSEAAQRIAQQFATPARLSQLLRESDVDFEAVDALVRHLQLGAADTLIQELINSNSRTTRRGILDRLARLGPGIEPMVVKRLRDERWFVLRNMLHVLNAAGCTVERVPLTTYQAHTDPRVRREAMQLLFKDPIARDRAMAVAFRDTDVYALRTALREARAGLPDAAVPILAKRIVDPDFPPEYRAPAIQLLGRSKSALALEALLRTATGGTTLLGKPRLAAKSPELLAALRGLARSWRTERRAAALLEAAAASGDEQVRSAIEPGRNDVIPSIDDADEQPAV